MIPRSSFVRYSRNGRHRRVSRVTSGPGEGPLTGPTAGTQRRPREQVFMPHSCHLAFARKAPLSRSRNGRGASELLHHVIAREAGRLAVDRRRDIVALFLVEA
jgi:hypothetical protein